MNQQTRILKEATKILEHENEGLTYAELLNRLFDITKISKNVIGSTIPVLPGIEESEIYKPERGIYRLKKFMESEQEITEEKLPEKEQKSNEEKEKRFYEPFLDYLKNELDECSHAIVLGGKGFRGKWETPDVFAVKNRQAGDIVDVQEYLGVELKYGYTDIELLTGFAQACCYLLYCHKSYLVIPKESNKIMLKRLGSLCMVFGIGLILYNNMDKDNPMWELKNRPIRHDPDIYYVNEKLKILKDQIGVQDFNNKLGFHE